MLNVGLTGGIGTGKSTVARMLEDKGATLIDFDRLAWQAVEPGKEAWQMIVAHFGDHILADDKTINRKKLGQIVFQDKAKLSRLNAIVHPVVFAQWDKLLADVGENRPDAIVVSDVPLLMELRLQASFDVVVLVFASPVQQVERLVTRNGCTSEEASLRLAAQMPIEEKSAQADFIIDNSNTLEDTRKQVDKVWDDLTVLNRKNS